MHGNLGTKDFVHFWSQLLTARHCHRCSGTMRLALVMPGNPGQDTRTFECTNCDNAEDHVVDWR
jgi:hypothetical protein